MSTDYLQQLNFKKDKLLLRIKQSSDIKKEILNHIKQNNKQFLEFFDTLCYLEDNGDLEDLHHNYKDLDIIDCQMAILDNKNGIIEKMVAFSKYYQSLEDNDRDDIIGGLSPQYPLIGLQPNRL